MGPRAAGVCCCGQRPLAKSSRRRSALVADHDAPFRQQVFVVAKAQGEPEIEPERVLDDFGRKPVPLERVPKSQNRYGIPESAEL